MHVYPLIEKAIDDSDSDIWLLIKGIVDRKEYERIDFYTYLEDKLEDIMDAHKRKIKSILGESSS